MGTVISNYEFGKVNSGAPSTSYYDVDVEIDSEAGSTKMGVLQFKLPTRESIELSNKAFISTVTIRFTLTNDGSDIEIYKIKDEFASKINFHEMSFYSYNQEGQDASNKKWNPANWQQGHLATSDTTITEGNKLDTEPGGSSTETLTLSEEDLQECGWTFGSICTLAVYNSGTDNFVLTQNDVVINL